MTTPDPILAVPVETPQPQRPDLYVGVATFERFGKYGTSPAYPVVAAIQNAGQQDWLIFLLPGTQRLAEMARMDAAMERFKELFVYEFGGLSRDCSGELRDAAREAGLMEKQE